MYRQCLYIQHVLSMQHPRVYASILLSDFQRCVNNAMAANKVIARTHTELPDQISGCCLLHANEFPATNKPIGYPLKYESGPFCFCDEENIHVGSDLADSCHFAQVFWSSW